MKIKKNNPHIKMVSVLFLLGIFTATLGCSSINFKTRSELAQTDKHQTKNLNSKEKSQILSNTQQSPLPKEGTAESTPSNTSPTNNEGLVNAPLSSEMPPPQRVKVGLILGPGGVKTMAHAGFIKGLLANKISIDKIIGIEWGALPAALFAKEGKVFQMEWSLYRFEQSVKPSSKSSFFFKEPKGIRVKKIENFLTENFPGNLENMKVPMACPSVSILSGTLVWQNRGPVKQALENCLPYPPAFTHSSPWMAEIFSLNEAYEEMKAQQMDVIIYVDVLGKGNLMDTKLANENFEASLLWQEFRRYQSSLKLEGLEIAPVNTDKFLMLDFSNRAALFLAGEKAAEKLVDKIVQKYNF